MKEADSKYLMPARRRPTELGALPADWDVIELATRTTIQSGIAKNANAALRDPVAVPYLRVANVQDGYLDLREVALIEIERSDLNRYAVLPGDVLMNEGGDLDKLGRGALWHGQIDPCVHQNHVFVVRCKNGLVPEYLNAWTSTAQARRYFMLAGRQTTNLASINKTSLGELTVAVPPTEGEQREIAKAISDTDALIDSLEQLLTKKRQIKQGAMQELLTGKRRLPGFSASVPTIKLGTVCKMQSGGTPPATQPSFFDGPHHWVAISDITQANKYLFTTDRSLSDAGLDASPAQIFPKGTVLYAMYASVGECCIATMEICTSQAILAMQPAACLDAEYLYYWLCGTRSNAKSAVQQGTQGNLNKGIVQDMLIQLPDIQEQQAVAKVLSDMDSDIAATEERLTKARALKQAMAQALLTGRIRLVEPTT